jgi:outer membrane lipoprotein-sorting protein
VNILRRLPLSRLLLLCALVVGLGVSATAIAFALDSGPTPPPKPLAQAVHDALAATPVEGVSANVTLTNHLLEGVNLASGSSTGSGGGEAGALSSSPLLSGASGRLWIAKDGRVRLELQAEKGDTQIFYDGHTLTMYDASANTLYRYQIPAHEATAATASNGSHPIDAPGTGGPQPSGRGVNATQTRLSFKPDATTSDNHEVPSVAKIEEAISKLEQHVNVSGATPTDIAGQAAYTARVSPNESGSLLGGAELSWDAVHGVPLRLALYSSTSSSPVIELAASEISYGPVADSVFEFTPPAGAKVEEVTLPDEHGAKQGDSTHKHAHPKVTTVGGGVSGVAVIERNSKPGEQPLALPEGLPKVNVNGTSATELPTALGTLLAFERSGVRYLLVGSVTPEAIESVAKGL